MGLPDAVVWNIGQCGTLTRTLALTLPLPLPLTRTLTPTPTLTLTRTRTQTLTLTLSRHVGHLFVRDPLVIHQVRYLVSGPNYLVITH